MKTERVQIVAELVEGSQSDWQGQFATETLAKCESLVAAGDLARWQINHELLGNDWALHPSLFG